MPETDQRAIDRGTIESALTARPGSLRFAAELEARFERDTSQSRSRRLALGGLVGLITYDLLIVTDWWLTPDVFATALWVRLGIMTPIEIAAIFALWTGLPYLWRELAISALGAVAPAATQLYIMLCSSSIHRAGQLQAIVLVIIFSIAVQRLRFVFAVPTCLICLGLYILSLHQLPEYPLELRLSASVVLASVVVFSLFVSYRLERELRLNYVLNLKTRIQNDELDELSRRDALTGLPNRRSLNERLAEICSNTEIVSVILVDIDHFKKFNDSAGHLAGDRCLKSIGEILSAALMPGIGTIYRYGGEEFIVVTPKQDFLEARLVGETLRAGIERSRIRHPGLQDTGYVTVSVGVATGLASELKDIEDIIGNADTALYAAKRNGRNQVWPPLSERAANNDPVGIPPLGAPNAA